MYTALRVELSESPRLRTLPLFCAYLANCSSTYRNSPIDVESKAKQVRPYDSCDQGRGRPSERCTLPGSSVFACDNRRSQLCR